MAGLEVIPAHARQHTKPCIHTSVHRPWRPQLWQHRESSSQRDGEERRTDISRKGKKHGHCEWIVPSAVWGSSAFRATQQCFKHDHIKLWGKAKVELLAQFIHWKTRNRSEGLGLRRPLKPFSVHSQSRRQSLLLNLYVIRFLTAAVKWTDQTASLVYGLRTPCTGLQKYFMVFLSFKLHKHLKRALWSSGSCEAPAAAAAPEPEQDCRAKPGLQHLHMKGGGGVVLDAWVVLWWTYQTQFSKQKGLKFLLSLSMQHPVAQINDL